MKGAVLLPTILTIGFLLVGIGLAASLIVLLLNRSNYAIRLSANALAAARAGVDEAQLRILRDNNWPVTNCDTSVSAGESNNTLTLTVGQYPVYVCIKRELFPNKTVYLVKSLGRVSSRHQRQLEATLWADPITHQLRLETINEVPI